MKPIDWVMWVVVGGLVLLTLYITWLSFRHMQLLRAERALHKLNVERAKKSAVLSATTAVSEWRADGATHAINVANRGLHEARNVVFSVVDAQYRRLSEVTLSSLAPSGTETVDIETPRSDMPSGAGKMLPWTLVGQYEDGLRTHRHYLAHVMSSPHDVPGATVATPIPRTELEREQVRSPRR